jgi:hypothetical protein
MLVVEPALPVAAVFFLAVPVVAMLLMANGSQLVTACTAAPHVQHRATPRSVHSVEIK